MTMTESLTHHCDKRSYILYQAISWSSCLVHSTRFRALDRNTMVAVRNTMAASISILLLVSCTTTCFTFAYQEGEANSMCISAERAALLSFKAGISSDPEDRLGSWRGHDCCQWSGVKCSNITGHVLKLNLRNNYFQLDNLFIGPNSNGHWLRGQISSSLLDLHHLRHLELSGNLLGDVGAACLYLNSWAHSRG